MNTENPAYNRLWISVFKILRLQLVIQISEFRRSRLIRKILLALLALLLLALLAGAFALSWLLLGLLRSPEITQYVGDLSVFLRVVPTLIFTGEVAIILVSSFGVLLQGLYLSGDMDFLLAAPLPVRSVFIAKMLQAVLPNFSLISLFGLPLLWGLGASAGYNFLYYPLTVIILAALALAAASLSSLLVMLIARIFPARRVVEVIGFVVGISSLVCSQSSNLFRFSSVSSNQMGPFLQQLNQLNSLWSPLSWAGQGLVRFGEGSLLAGGALVLLALSLAGAVFYGALTTAERLYYTGWARMQASSRSKKSSSAPREKKTAQASTNLIGWVPLAIQAIISKDFRMLRRDLRNLSQLITPLILGLIYAIGLLRTDRIPAGRGEAPPWFMNALQTGFNYGDLLIALFVAWMLAMRLSMMAFSQEGQSYWIIKSAPVRTNHLLTAKFLVAFLPSTAICWAYLLIIAGLQPAKLVMLPASFLIVALCIAGLTGINLAFGVAGATFDWKNPQKMIRGTVGCIGPLVSFAYFGIALVLMLGPTFLAGLLGLPAIAGTLAGLALGGAFCTAATLVPLQLVARRVERLNES